LDFETNYFETNYFETISKLSKLFRNKTTSLLSQQATNCFTFKLFQQEQELRQLFDLEYKRKHGGK